MPGLSLVTRGMLVRRQSQQSFFGEGDAELKADDDIATPKIYVIKTTISESSRPDINENSLKIRSVKLVLE